MSSPLSSEEILRKVQAKLAEQNEVIREQQVQIQEQQVRITELEQKLESLNSAEMERDEMLNRLAELVE